MGTWDDDSDVTIAKADADRLGWCHRMLGRLFALTALLHAGSGVHALCSERSEISVQLAATAAVLFVLMSIFSFKTANVYRQNLDA